ncbi:MAG: M48 family metalloprotease [Gemmatimonadetes bacterium]|nr:M48 family metalloprotease [Gemmatimonadota bacterium]
MRSEPLLIALIIAAPAMYAWWSGRRLLRSLDDPALAELLQGRRRRISQVTVGAIAVSAFAGASLAWTIPMLVGLLVAQFPLRRAVHGDECSLAQFVAYCAASFIAGAGLLMFALLTPTLVAHLVRDRIPGTTRASFTLALALGALCGIVVFAWYRWFTRIWLRLHRASPLERDVVHAPLLPRLEAVLDRAGDRLSRRPSIHRYGAKGFRMANAIALCSLHEPAVAISDTLLDTLDADETTAIFAHEIAHHEYFNAARLRTRRWAIVGVALLVAVLPALLLATGPHSDLMISLAFLVVLALLMLRGQSPKQQQETASDLRAVELTNDPDALIRALTKIHVLARLPRRWAEEVERAATHPSLARRIQAIRALDSCHPERAERVEGSAPGGTPTVIQAAAAGSYVVLDATRAHWLDGVPAGTPADLASLREHSATYRAMTYAELAELRLVAAHGQRALRAADLGGRSWSVDVREADVPRIQETLDRVDSRFGARRIEPALKSERAARILAAALLIAALLGGGTAAVAIPALATMFAPTVTSLAALGAMGTAGLLLLGSSDSFGMPREWGAVLLAGALGLGAMWLAWQWHRARREAITSSARLGVRLMFVALGLAVLTTLLWVSTVWTSPRELAADENTLSLAITLCGIGAAMFTLRVAALRFAGGAAALLGVVALAGVTLAERVWPATSEIGWDESGLSLVASVPLPHDMDAVELSPRGTRWLARRSFGNDDEDDYILKFTTGDVAASAAPYTVTALDAVLPSETQMLVLATVGDSLELRLENVHADSTQRVVWRRSFETLYAPALRLVDGGTRWQVSGMRLNGRAAGTLVTLDGAVGPNPADTGVARTEFAADTLHGQSVFTYRDGSRLVMTLARNPIGAMRGRSMLWSTLAAMRGTNMTWQLSRRDRDGSHPVTSLHGYVRCWAATEDDVAVCADQSVRGVHVVSIARDGRFADLGMLSRRYQRASASPQGLLVASSYMDRSLAVIDVVPRKGVRITLPPATDGRTRDATASGDAVAILLSGEEGSRLLVYRLGPLIQTASRTRGGS